jgi:hypothetical protein
MIKLAALFLVVAAAAPAVSYANDEHMEHSGACKADREKFCKDVKPGEGRIVKCMKEHEADLSPECKEKMSEAKEKMGEKKEEWNKACGEDQKTLCGDVKKGHGAVMKCLKKNESKLSEGCKSYMSEMKEKHKERKAKREGGSMEKGGGMDKGSAPSSGEQPK